eukprot:m.353567 g.353567  ORF g.353567 m.353567 type:complete len:474 (-) comp16593_c2_seq4:125-1546(-)
MTTSRSKASARRPSPRPTARRPGKPPRRPDRPTPTAQPRPPLPLARLALRPPRTSPPTPIRGRASHRPPPRGTSRRRARLCSRRSQSASRPPRPPGKSRRPPRVEVEVEVVAATSTPNRRHLGRRPVLRLDRRQAHRPPSRRKTQLRRGRNLLTSASRRPVPLGSSRRRARLRPTTAGSRWWHRAGLGVWVRVDRRRVLPLRWTTATRRSTRTLPRTPTPRRLPLHAPPVGVGVGEVEEGTTLHPWPRPALRRATRLALHRQRPRSLRPPLPRSRRRRLRSLLWRRRRARRPSPRRSRRRRCGRVGEAMPPATALRATPRFGPDHRSRGTSRGTGGPLGSGSLSARALRLQRRRQARRRLKRRPRCPLGLQTSRHRRCRRCCLLQTSRFRRRHRQATFRRPTFLRPICPLLTSPRQTLWTCRRCRRQGQWPMSRRWTRTRMETGLIARRLCLLGSVLISHAVALVTASETGRG